MRVMNVDLTTHYYFACHWLVIHLIGEYPTQNLTVTNITKFERKYYVLDNKQGVVPLLD